MRVWRITVRDYALDRVGAGARLAGGRWNSAGIPAIYAATTPELAAFEKLVHTGETLPTDLVLVIIDLPDDDRLYETAPIGSLPAGWANLPSSAAAAAFGDSFLTRGEKLGLIVPSALIPEAKNILINPNHPEFHKVTMSLARDFKFDSRLRP